MEELLEALRNEDLSEITRLASELFVTNDNKLNRPQANEFEYYAPCKIYPKDGEAYIFENYVGMIDYNHNIYFFGQRR